MIICFFGIIYYLRKTFVKNNIVIQIELGSPTAIFITYKYIQSQYNSNHTNKLDSEDYL